MQKSLRFRVLERDYHTCRYCGRGAPNVQLEVDHVRPRSQGGTDTLENLVTACLACNRGKFDSLIDQALPDLDADQYRDEQARLQDLQSYWHRMSRDWVWEQWADYTGRQLRRRDAMALEEMLIYHGLDRVERALRVVAYLHGFEKGEDEGDYCVDFTTKEVDQLLTRWKHEANACTAG